MARKKIREYAAKRLVVSSLRDRAAANVVRELRAAQIRLADVEPVVRAMATEDEMKVSAEHPGEKLSVSSAVWDAYFARVEEENPWLRAERLVVKPDMLFGKRGKSDLVLLNADWHGAQQFIQNNMQRELSVNGIAGTVDTLIVEPFVRHDREFYVCIQSTRDGDRVLLSDCGGVDIEENWDRVRSAEIAADQHELSAKQLDTVLACLSPADAEHGIQKLLRVFLVGCFDVYRALDMTLLEMNPFTVVDNIVVPLDMRVELDSYAHFKHSRSAWEGLEFPEPWGRVKLPEERAVQALDDKSGASLKLSVLNPHGRIWTMVAGGGASVVYADTVVNLGMGHELANYAEYSGNPKQEETYLYAKTLLSLATRELDGRRKVLLIGGGVANFTDVAATFTGIIQALKDCAGKLQEAKMHLFVRRGGPNYEAGLRMMQQLGEEIQVPVTVFGPDASMTSIVKLARDYLAADAHSES